MMRALARRALAAGLRLPDLASTRAFRQQARTIDLIRALDINIVLDVGANRGFWSRHLRQSGYSGHIVSFEPLAANAAELDAKRDARWIAQACALGTEEGEADFNVVLSGPDDETVLSSFLPIRNSSARTHTERVTVKRLDSFLPLLRSLAAEQRIFLKMDTQGFDLQVIAGAGDALDHIRLLQSEISVESLYEGMPPYTEALDTYRALGFTLQDLFVVNRTATGGILEYDALLARPF